MSDVPALAPAPDEIAVALVAPGQAVDVHTITGVYRVIGDDPGGDHPDIRVAMVPHDPAAVGWGETRAVLRAVGPGGARTATGLRSPVLRRVLRGHQLDEAVWQQARAGLGVGPLYVRHERVPYYGRTRMAAVAVRAVGDCETRGT